MSRVVLTKTIRNACWQYNMGENFSGKCSTGCGMDITVFNYECGHIKSVKCGGENKIDNLKPICGTCNKSMGTKDMIEFIKDSGYSARFLKTSSKTEKINIRAGIKIPIKYNINTNFRIVHYTYIGLDSYIDSYYYLLSDKFSFLINYFEECAEYIYIDSKNTGIEFIKKGVKYIQLSNFKYDDFKKYKIDINMDILLYLIKSNNCTIIQLMRILSLINFDIECNDYSLALFKACNSCSIVCENYSEEYELIIEQEDIFKEFEDEFIKHNSIDLPNVFLKNFMFDNKINIVNKKCGISI